MRVLIASLFLTLVVFLNYVELSYQVRNQAGPSGAERTRPGRWRMALPPPYYYVNDRYNSTIRSHEHPNAHAVITEDYIFLGMADDLRNTFYPISYGGGYVAFNLRGRNLIRLEPEEVRELSAGFREVSPDPQIRRAQSPGRNQG